MTELAETWASWARRHPYVTIVLAGIAVAVLFKIAGTVFGDGVAWWTVISGTGITCIAMLGARIVRRHLSSQTSSED